jgi:glycosyltransferase involved in cell wall biosynthesis
MEIELSILIATMPSRQHLLIKLISEIDSQRTGREIEFIYDDIMSYNIGTKRNKLLQRAKGDYIVFIDDDDEISPNYVSEILKAIESNPDSVGINGIITTNGHNQRKWFISKEYKTWHEANGIYYRTPNHISPVRRELALQAGFPEWSFGEDAEYSRRLLPLLKTEVIISEPLYHYKFVNTK